MKTTHISKIDSFSPDEEKKDINKMKNYEESINKITSSLFFEELNDNITFDGKIFKKIKTKKNNKDEITYKCIYNRRNEANRQKLHLGAFCNATLKAKLGVRLNTKGYFVSLAKNHSNECLTLLKSIIINNNETINEYIDFKNKVFTMLNDNNLYDRKDCKNKIESIYQGE